MPKGKHSNHVNGSKHFRWNSGQKRSSHGYVKVRVGKSHPLSDPNGYAYEHILVWCAAGNSRPTNSQVIHHINEDKADNRIENLELKSRVDHGVGHNKTVTDEQVVLIRCAYASGTKDMPALSEEFGIPVSRVSKIIRGECRVSAGGPISTNNRGKHAAGRVLDGREWNEVPQ